jgi:hypothetical protein
MARNRVTCPEGLPYGGLCVTRKEKGRIGTGVRLDRWFVRARSTRWYGPLVEDVPGGRGKVVSRAEALGGLVHFFECYQCGWRTNEGGGQRWGRGTCATMGEPTEAQVMKSSAAFALDAG